MPSAFGRTEIAKLHHFFNIKRIAQIFVTLVAGVILFACSVNPPDNVKPVTGFELNRYLGEWYEIARLDHSFEEGLSQVTATYKMDGDQVKVINRGYEDKKGEWSEAEGTAKFVTDKTVGHLKVSFFGPFYGAYVIFELDKDNYQYAMISGDDYSYLWILSRTPTLDKAVLDSLIDKATEKGFDTSKLIMVNQSK